MCDILESCRPAATFRAARWGVIERVVCCTRLIGEETGWE